MKGNAPKDRRSADTPAEVIVNSAPRVPDFDPTLGIDVVLPPLKGTSANKLVTLGDSVTHGFQSGAIFNTRISWPKIVAWEIGCDATFRFPLYEGYGGIPLNIEYLLRSLEHTYGDAISWWELPGAGFDLRSLMAQIEDYWERGPGSTVKRTNRAMHNLAVYGWDIRDVLSRTANNLQAAMHTPKDDVFAQVVENANIRAALGVYSSMDPGDTVLDAARKLGNEGALPGSGGDATTPGIETLVVFIGANNVLGSVTQLKVSWSAKGYDALGSKDRYTVWCPSHFAAEYQQLVEKLKAVNARHVILVNVPHVTIAPIARGVNRKVGAGSRYFPFYTRPWITDEQFNEKDDPNITENQVRAIDSAVDQYNDTIANEVRACRQAGLDWYVLDIAGMLDRLAARRYINDAQARPAWWTRYDLPSALNQLDPVPDSRFFSSGPRGREQGGLFSLDGIHPTTITYGLIAQEVINVMQRAKVALYYNDGVTLRQGPVQVDFDRLLRLDSLISNPPRSLGSDMKTLGWLDETADIIGKLNPFN